MRQIATTAPYLLEFGGSCIGRRVDADNSTNPPSLWVGSNHGASIVHIQPLE